MRVIRLAKRITVERDGVTIGFGLAILVITTWLIALPFSTAVQNAALRRYHLQNDHFVCWAVQQIIPSLYNFENEYTFRPDNALSPVVREFVKVRQLNHFPLRIVTYFDSRYILFSDGNSGEVELTSRYQSSLLTSRWKVSTLPDQSLKLESLDRHD